MKRFKETKYLCYEDGTIINEKTKRSIGYENRRGYVMVFDFYDKKWYPAHRMIWEAFNGPIPEGYEVHHIDGRRTNNALSNLILLSKLEHYFLHLEEQNRKKAETWKKKREKNLQSTETSCTFVVAEQGADSRNSLCLTSLAGAESSLVRTA